MTAERTAEIEGALALVRDRIRRACGSADRRDDEVDLVVVTKTFPASDVEILARLGVSDVGENRDQEASVKRAQVGSALRWHMLGRLQRNKVVSVASWADAVDSVDRLELVAALGRACRDAGRRIEVLVQVSLDTMAREGRGGVRPEDAIDLAAAVDAEPALDLRGVMGVAPYPGDPNHAFSLLADVSASIRDRWPQAQRISAGMSGDLEEAIAHGATQVRVGGAILGTRATVQ